MMASFNDIKNKNEVKITLLKYFHPMCAFKNGGSLAQYLCSMFLSFNLGYYFVDDPFSINHKGCP